MSAAGPPAGSSLVPLSHCTDCGTALNGAWDKDGAHVPKEGDLSVCIHCGNAMVYRADQTLRSMSLAEWNALNDAERAELTRMQTALDRARRASAAQKPPAARKKSPRNRPK